MIRKLWFLLVNMAAAISVGTAVGTATAALVFPGGFSRRGGFSASSSSPPPLLLLLLLSSSSSSSSRSRSRSRSRGREPAQSRRGGRRLREHGEPAPGPGLGALFGRVGPGRADARVSLSVVVLGSGFLFCPSSWGPFQGTVLGDGRGVRDGADRGGFGDAGEREQKKSGDGEEERERNFKKETSFFLSLARSLPLPFDISLLSPLSSSFLKKKQFMLAEATLRGKDGKRRGKARPPLPRAPATAAAAAAAAGTAAGAGAGAAAASPPRDSSAELVPLRRVQEQEGEEEEEEEGMAEKRRAARTSRLPPRLPASPFVSNGGDGNRTSSPPPPSSSLPVSAPPAATASPSTWNPEEKQQQMKTGTKTARGGCSRATARKLLRQE